MAPVEQRRPIPTGAVRTGEWNVPRCSAGDVVTAQAKLNELGELGGVWNVHHKTVLWSDQHNLVSDGFLAGVATTELLCSPQSSPLPPWSLTLVLNFKLCRYLPCEESQFKGQSSTVSFISRWAVQGLAVSHHPVILLCNSGSSKQLLYFVLQSP